MIFLQEWFDHDSKIGCLLKKLLTLKQCLYAAECKMPTIE